MRLTLILAIQTSACVTGHVGCSKPTLLGAPEVTSQVSKIKPLHLKHSVGRVVTGTQVEYRFIVQNPFPMRVALESESDIQKSCGCTTLELGKRQLQPGAKTEIFMRVSTQGKSGRFDVSATTAWTLGDGRAWPVHLSLEGVADAVLGAQPVQVQFSAADVLQRVEKQVSLSSNLPVDWAQLRVHLDSPYFEVATKETTADGLIVRLRPIPPTDMREFSSSMFVTVPLADGVDAGVKECTLAVPAIAAQQIGVQVTPSVVLVRFFAGSESGVARFILRGDDLPVSSDPIESMTCQGFAISWKTREIASTTQKANRLFYVDLTLSGENQRSDTDEGRRRSLNIQLSDNRPLNVPLVFVRPDM